VTNNSLTGSRNHWIATDSTVNHAALVAAGSDLTMVAGGSLSVLGSTVTAGGDALLAARGPITIASVLDTVSTTTFSRKDGLFSSSRTFTNQSSQTNVASVVAAGGDLTVVSGSDLAVKASHLVAGGDLGLRAAGSVSILAGEDVHRSMFSKRSSGFGLFGGDGNLDIYHSKRTTAATTSVDNAPSTLVAGGNASVVAGQDVKLVGSAVMAGKQATLVAGRDLIIEPGQDRTSAGYSRTVSGVGIGAQASNGSASISAGAHSKGTFTAQDTTTPVASLVAGGTGVALRADRDVTITAADLVSGGNLSIKAGRDLSLLSQAQVEHTLTARRQSFAGLKLEVSQNVTGAIDTLKSAGHTFNSGYGGDTYRAIGAISGALKTVDAVYELTHPSVSASLTAGASSSRSRSERYEETARPTTIRAGGMSASAPGATCTCRAPRSMPAAGSPWTPSATC